MKNKTVFILGGLKSGKSTYAVNLAKKAGGTVTYIATAAITDREIMQRVQNHVKSRPAGWKTVEEQINLPLAINKVVTKTVIIDCINFWVSNNLYNKHSEESILEQAERFCAVLKKKKMNCFIISNEVGLCLVPPNKIGRVFQSVLGKVNQIMAKNADEVVFIAAGIAVKIK